jgi:hypothetical protein
MEDPMIIEASEDNASAPSSETITCVDKENNKTAVTSKAAAQSASESSSSLTKSTTLKMDTKTATKSTTTNQYAIPWVEKFRPRTLDDVLGNVETVIRLRAIAKDGNLPNLILCGPPGTGTWLAIFACTFVVQHICAYLIMFFIDFSLSRLHKGKTTSVHALARELLGSYYKDAVLELNASDARGIDVRSREMYYFICTCCCYLSFTYILICFFVVTFFLKLNQFIGGTESNKKFCNE